MTKENEKLRDCLRDAESIITNALRSQPEGDNECKIHLTKAVKDVWNLVYDAKSQMPDGSKYAMEGMGHPSAYDRLFNAAALREALVKIEKMAHCDLCNVYPRYRDEFNDKIGGIEREARAALSAPPRNCDIGTADEQSERFGRFCGHYRVRRCKDCPLLAKGPCEFEWAQMPYGVGL